VPVAVTFDVNNEEVRKLFLREIAPQALTTLRPDTQPSWGRMSAQQMVEHLTWAFELSTGRSRVECLIPIDQRERMKVFLYSNHPSPREFMNPALASGLPELKHSSLPGALATFDVARRHFLEFGELGPRAASTHPIFGPICEEEWSRVHFKHVFHHLQQFGLVVAA
jgi:oxepin-CoA hydrolase/3-oxo-5,6-dehydrosuberyl-CoA semialdehyde dehydrogenase